MTTKTKILLIDLETMANLSWVWGKYEQNVIAYEKEWYMLSFAYKWLGESKVSVKSLPDYRGYNRAKNDDRALVKDLWELFDQADIIIAHNGNSFDIKKSNAKFIEHGLTPPSPYKVIDTKTVAKKYFKFNSNKLDDLGNILGLGRKIDTGGFDLWLGCASGDKKSWDKMCKYNKQDVLLLEKVYLRLRNWIINHPRTSDSPINEKCPNCGSNHLQKRGFTLNKTTKLQRWQCQSCSSWHSTSIKKVK